jgi:hypothetical protein
MDTTKFNSQAQQQYLPTTPSSSLASIDVLEDLGLFLSTSVNLVHNAPIE